MDYDILLLLRYMGKDIAEVLAYLPAGIAAFLIILLCGRIWFRPAPPDLYRPAASALYHPAGRGRNAVSVDRRKAEKRRQVCMALLLSYGVIILFITFLSREPGARDGMDLMPLATVGNSVQGDAYVVENVLLFIPMGLLLPLALPWARGFLRCAGTGLAVSLLIEVSQFFTKRGFVQTDDVLTNVLGTAVGYGIFALVWKKYGRLTLIR